jgi:hypothetical protein
MPKKGSLFLLIKSMNKSEKRYFKLFAASGKADLKCLRLFDIMDKQKELDDEYLKVHFKNELFVKQLHVTKIYLSELILKSLRNYHTNNSINSQLLDLLRDVEILFGRELYDLCFYKLSKAERIASEYEKTPLHLEVLAWKRKLMIAQHQSNKREIQHVHSEEKRAIANLSELNNYWKHTLDIFNFSKDKKLVKMISTSSTTSLQAKTFRHHLLYSGYFMGGDLPKAEKEISVLIKHLEKYPARIEDDPAPYLTALGNKIGLLLKQRRWAEIYPLVQAMREVPAKYRLSNESKFTVRLWLRIFNLELEVFRDTKQLDKGIALIKEVGAYIDEHKNSIPDNYHIMLYYQMASIYFLKNDFSKSLYWINQILNTNFGEVRNDLQCYSKLLNLMVHFELNNIIVLRYSVDSTRRFFKKKKFNEEFELKILRLFSRLGQSYPSEYGNTFRKSYQELYGKGVKINEELQDYIDFRGWIENKIKKK